MSRHGRTREDVPPISDPGACSFTCDWGNCNEETVAWRWDAVNREWLPVCAEHREGD